MPPPPPGYSDGAPAPVEQKNGLGTASLVLGIISIVGLLSLIFGIPFAILGLIFGIIGRGRAKRGEASNGGVALAGILTSAFGLLAAIAIIVVGVIFFADDFNNLNDCVEAAETQADRDQCAEDFANDLGG